ncbi:MAG: ricin-type beta-trefoil lectin domain protein [Saprospiraceae bacterium]|nr:ricin-type beta-trefoil lectin domain protein [Saprospiraceae bacterium]
MKNLMFNFRKTGNRSALVCLLSGLACTFLQAQIATTVTYNNSDDPHYFDVEVPASGYLYLTARGGDGGQRPDDNKGGGGAKVYAWMSIGNGQGEIPPHSILRLIPGQRGGSSKWGAGGGGGTAVAFKGPEANDPWNLLVVAGGGGGAGYDYSGRSANVTTNGSNGIGQYGNKLDNAGTDGKAGGKGFSSGGGGAYGGGTSTDCAGEAGFLSNNTPVGGSGGKENCSEDANGFGGFGFGGGAAGVAHQVPTITGSKTYYSGGGGGGYSGGGGGEYSGGGGGSGSYVNPDWVPTQRMLSMDITDAPENGSVSYYFSSSPPVKLIKLATDQSKCIDDYKGATTKGTNIQLYNCHGLASQQWLIDGSAFRFVKDMNKCLDLSGSNTANGTNIQLWDCNGTDAQNWIYDVRKQAIRSGINFDKCLDLNQSNTANGTNIQLYDCNGTKAQKWLIDGLPAAMPSGTNNRLRLVLAPDKCVDVKDAKTANGTNIQVNTCKTGNSQYFLFEDGKIKMQAAPEKCLDIDPSADPDYYNKVVYLGGLAKETAPIYTHFNVRLWDCNNTGTQEWVYDAIGNTFHHAMSKYLCLDVDNSGTADGTNIQIYMCNGTDAQKFVIDN